MNIYLIEVTFAHTKKREIVFASLSRKMWMAERRRLDKDDGDRRATLGWTSVMPYFVNRPAFTRGVKRKTLADATIADLRAAVRDAKP